MARKVKTRKKVVKKSKRYKGLSDAPIGNRIGAGGGAKIRTKAPTRNRRVPKDKGLVVFKNTAKKQEQRGNVTKGSFASMYAHGDLYRRGYVTIDGEKVIARRKRFGSVGSRDYLANPITHRRQKLRPVNPNRKEGRREKDKKVFYL